MGAIIFWSLIRLAITLPVIWYITENYDGRFYIVWAALAIYAIVISPAIKQYKKFEEENKDVIKSTLCSTCKNFDKTAVLCLKLDEHPSIDKLPCEGLDWEPLINENSKEQFKEE